MNGLSVSVSSDSYDLMVLVKSLFMKSVIKLRLADVETALSFFIIFPFFETTSAFSKCYIIPIHYVLGQIVPFLDCLWTNHLLSGVQAHSIHVVSSVS